MHNGKPHNPSRLDGPNDRRRPAGRPKNTEAWKSPGSAFGKQAKVKKAFDSNFKNKA